MSSTTACPTHPGTDEHPTLEQLRDYHQGQLTERDEDLIQEHFISCSSCRDTFLELADFLDGASGEPRWSTEELVKEWQKIRASLSEVPDEEEALAGSRHR